MDLVFVVAGGMLFVIFAVLMMLIFKIDDERKKNDAAMRDRTCRLNSIEARKGYYYMRRCSECKCMTPAESFYCAHCGAKVVK